MLLLHWDMNARLTALHGTTSGPPPPPDYQGTLREAIRKACDWPNDAEPSIILNRADDDQIILGREEIYQLAAKLGYRNDDF